MLLIFLAVCKLVNLSAAGWNAAHNVWQASHSHAGSETTPQALGGTYSHTHTGKSDAPKGFQSPTVYALTYITLLLQRWHSRLLEAITSLASCKELGVKASWLRKVAHGVIAWCKQFYHSSMSQRMRMLKFWKACMGSHRDRSPFQKTIVRAMRFCSLRGRCDDCWRFYKERLRGKCFICEV